jgi:hypothetical protein
LDKFSKFLFLYKHVVISYVLQERVMASVSESTTKASPDDIVCLYAAIPAECVSDFICPVTSVCFQAKFYEMFGCASVKLIVVFYRFGTFWSGVENEKMMRCCVGIDSLGAVIPTSSSTSGDLDKCIDILGNYLSKHTLRIDKNLLAPLAVENLAIAEATGAAPDQLQGQLAASVEHDLQTNEEDDEDDGEAIAMTADHIFQQQLDETKHKDEVFSTSVLGELGIAGVKLCYFEFNAETIVDNSSPGLALRDAILRLQLRLAAESQQQTSASTVASDESTDPVENTDEREMAVDTTEKSTPTATATRISAVGNTLLIITTQANTETARKLSKRRLAAQNVRSTAVWTKDMEQELRQAYAKSNIAHASFKIL